MRSNIGTTVQKLVSQAGLLLLMLVLAYVIGYAGRAFATPPANPPNNNVADVIDIGTASQTKSGTLSLNAMSVLGNVIVEDRLGIGVASPTYTIDMAGSSGVGIRFPDGTVQTTAAGGITSTFTQYIQVQDRKNNGTGGGNSVTGSYGLRTLNTVVWNSLPGASLSGNAVILPAGIYYVFGTAPAMSVGRNKLKLAQTSCSGTTLLLGTSEYADAGDGDSQSQAIVAGILDLSAQTNVVLCHRAQNSYATEGWGNPVGSVSAGQEVYSNLTIWKLD